MGNAKKRTMKKNIADLNRTCDKTIYFLFQTTYYLGNEVIPFHKFPDLCYLFVKVKANMTEYFYHHEKNCNEILFCISSVDRKKMLDRVQNSWFFGIMIDESTDIYVADHLVVFASFVEKKSSFLCFYWIFTY